MTNGLFYTYKRRIGHYAERLEIFVSEQSHPTVQFVQGVTITKLDSKHLSNVFVNCNTFDLNLVKVVNLGKNDSAACE